MSVKLSTPPRPTRADRIAAEAPALAREAMRHADAAASERQLLLNVKRAVSRAHGSGALTFHERDAMCAQILADLCEHAERNGPGGTLALPRPSMAELGRSAALLIASRKDARSASSPRRAWVDYIGGTEVASMDAPAHADEEGEPVALVETLAARPDDGRDVLDVAGADVSVLVEALADALTVDADPDAEPRPLTAPERRRVVIALTVDAAALHGSDDAEQVTAALTAGGSRRAMQSRAAEGRKLVRLATGAEQATPEQVAAGRALIRRAARSAGLTVGAAEPTAPAPTAPMRPVGRPADVLAWHDRAERMLATAAALRRRDPGSRTVAQATALGVVLASLRQPAPVGARHLPDGWRDAGALVDAESAKLGAWQPDALRPRPVARPVDRPAPVHRCVLKSRGAAAAGMAYR